MHLLGLVLLVGGIGFLDLRLLGLFRALPLAPLAAALQPLAILGLLLLAAAGAVLFAADATALAQSAVFRRKLLLIGAALLNALAFTLLWRRQPGRHARPPSPALRAMALASLLLWLAIATHGRWIAYA